MALWIQIVKHATLQSLDIIHLGIAFVKMDTMMIILLMKNA